MGFVLKQSIYVAFMNKSDALILLSLGKEISDIFKLLLVMDLHVNTSAFSSDILSHQRGVYFLD